MRALAAHAGGLANHDIAALSRFATATARTANVGEQACAYADLVSSTSHTLEIMMKPLTVLVGAMILASTSIAATAAPAEVTPDGLHRVDSSVLKLAWKRPGVDFKRYSKVMLVADGITFKEVTSRSRYDNAYPVPDEQRKKLNDMMLKVFTKELGKLKNYTLTDKGGPDVLIVRGAMLDVVSHIPPQPIGRGAIIQRDIGEATLVVELQDSMTGQFLARGADRRMASSVYPRKSNPVTNAADLELVAQGWARELRKRLDEL
jgi:hypothetical protein